jgi:integrase
MRGDGSIYNRNGIYWCKFHLNGRPYRESCGTTDEKHAQKHLRARLKEAGVSELTALPFLSQQERRQTIADLLDNLERDLRLRGKLSAPAVSCLKRAKAGFGMIRATSLTAAQVDAYIQTALENGYRPATINRGLEMLGQCFKLAEIKGPRIRQLSEAGNVRKGFTADADLRRVVDHLPAYLKDFTLFGFLTGMRRDSIKSLAWEDVDGDEIELRGEHAKNGEPQIIPAVGELAEILERRRAERIVNVGKTTIIAATIFHRDGLPIGDFRKTWGTATALAGVPSLLFHDLRRSAARNMTRAGIPQSVAMKISGHKTASMFQRYNIVDLTDVRQALTTVQEHNKKQTAKVAVMGRKK